MLIQNSVDAAINKCFGVTKCGCVYLSENQHDLIITEENDNVYVLLVRLPGLIRQIPLYDYMITGLILGLRPANEKRRYIATTSLTGWAQA